MTKQTYISPANYHLYSPHFFYHGAKTKARMDISDGLSNLELVLQKDAYNVHAERAWNNSDQNTYLRFYKGEIPFPGTDLYVMETHKLWGHMFTFLSENWKQVLCVFFPYMGDNPPGILPLQFHERMTIRADSSLMDRFHYSYMIAVDFYGWRIHNQHNGELDRSKEYKERYQWLEVNQSYWDAWTRILRSLIDMMLYKYVRYAVKYMVEEMTKGRLPYLRDRVRDVWIPMCHDPEDRKLFLKRLQKLDQSDSD